METNPNLWRDKTKANISVSAAGPISNFILMAAAFITLKVMLESGIVMPVIQGNIYNWIVPTPGQPAFMEPLAMLLSILMVLNLALGIFNLIPIPPLDGSHVLESLLPGEMADAYAQIRPYGFILLIALLYLGALSFIFNPSVIFVYQLLLS